MGGWKDGGWGIDGGDGWGMEEWLMDDGWMGGWVDGWMDG